MSLQSTLPRSLFAAARDVSTENSQIRVQCDVERAAIIIPPKKAIHFLVFGLVF